MRTAVDTIISNEGHLPLAPWSGPGKGLRMASLQSPARGRTGDLLEVRRGPDGCTTIFVGDVAGNGRAVASIAARARGLVREHLSPWLSLAAAFSSLNDAIEAALPPDSFITAVAARLDPRFRSVEVVSAGHLGPFVRRGRGGSRALGARPGPALGLERHQQFPSTTTFDLDPEDTIVFATDGVTDQFATTSDRYGLDGLLDELADLPLSPSSLCRQLLGSAAPVGCDASVLAVQLG